MKSLSYTHDVDPRPLSTPRVRLIPQEKLCFAIFPELVIATFLDASIPFEESVALKDAGKDRILGANVDASSTLMILAACTGLLKLEIDVPFIRNAQMSVRDLMLSDDT